MVESIIQERERQNYEVFSSSKIFSAIMKISSQFLLKKINLEKYFCEVTKKKFHMNLRSLKKWWLENCFSSFGAAFLGKQHIEIGFLCLLQYLIISCAHVDGVFCFLHTSHLKGSTESYYAKTAITTKKIKSMTNYKKKIKKICIKYVMFFLQNLLYCRKQFNL